MMPQYGECSILQPTPKTHQNITNYHQEGCCIHQSLIYPFCRTFRNKRRKFLAFYVKLFLICQNLLYKHTGRRCHCPPALRFNHLQISQTVLMFCLCGRQDAVPIGQSLLDVALLQFVEEELNVSFELCGVPDAAGGEVAVKALLVELLEGELRHEALGEPDLIVRIFPINIVEARSCQLVVTELLLVLFVEDEVEQLLGFVVAAHEGLPEEDFDARDGGGGGGEGGRLEDVFDGCDEVFLVVVVGTGTDLSLALRFLGRLGKTVERIAFRRTPSSQHPRLSRAGRGRLAQGLELQCFRGSLLRALNGEKLMNRLFDGFFFFFGQETELLGLAALETLKQPHFLEIVFLLHSNQNYQYKAMKNTYYKCYILAYHKYNKFLKPPIPPCPASAHMGKRTRRFAFVPSGKDYISALEPKTTKSVSTDESILSPGFVLLMIEQRQMAYLDVRASTMIIFGQECISTAP